MGGETKAPRGPLAGSIFSDMLYLSNGTSARVSSWDRSGANADARSIPAGAALELCDIPGVGCIRHMYFTILVSGQALGDPRYLRDLVLRAYWDGEVEPSIETPFGDFFGQGHGCIRFFRSLMVTVNEGAELAGANATTLTVGFNSYFPMPFRDGARLTLTNEGDDMIFVDGEEWPPSMHGTGTEECFGGGACPNLEYAGPYTGFHLIGNKTYAGKTSMYRFHVADPVRFRKSIRVTIEHGHANNFANDYSSTAFWYQAEPHAPFPELPPVEQRQPVVGDDPHDRAYAGLLKLLSCESRYTALLQEKALDPPEHIRHGVFQKLASEIAEAFAAKNYALAAEKCQAANDMFEAFLAKHE